MQPIKTDMILVTGPYDSGKSQVIKAICPTSFVTFRQDDSDKLLSDYGTAAALPVSAHQVLMLLEQPGARRWDMGLLLPERIDIRGVIITVDGTKPETFREAKSIAETMRAYPWLWGIFVTRHDSPDCWNENDMRTALRLNPGVFVGMCDAHQPDEVRSVLGQWLRTLPQDDTLAAVRARLQQG
jgi:uncharacterized protein